MEKRVISTQIQEEDRKIETSLRPQKLEDYIGQEKIKDNMKIYIEAAKARGEIPGSCTFLRTSGNLARQRLPELSQTRWGHI